MQNIQKAKISQFFKGLNIIDILTKSAFGKAKEIIENLIENNPDELSKFKLPRIIAIGNESTGKSSLFEKILKCPIFPRNSIICTKAPIRLVLNSGQQKYVIRNTMPGSEKEIVLYDKQEIYKNMMEINNSISPKHSDVITEHEIIIEFTEPNLPSLEFIDLPGLRAYPPDLATITTNLCKKYLSIQDIILCVIPATVTRLTSCQPLALINELNLCQNTILALTMADRLVMSEYAQEENINELLLNRILGTSDEMTYLKLKGCVAVINRTHNDTMNLEESDDMEIQCFEKLLNNLPTEYLKDKNTIEENITVKNLLTIINNFYVHHIQNNWKPIILEKINNDIKLINDKITELGPEIITKEVIDSFIKDHAIKLYDIMVKPAHGYIDDDEGTYYRGWNIKEDDDGKPICSEINTILFNASYINIINHFKNIVSLWLEKHYKKELLIKSFNSIFDEIQPNYIHKTKNTLLNYINIFIEDVFTCDNFKKDMKHISKSYMYALDSEYLAGREYQDPLMNKDNNEIINNLEKLYDLHIITPLLINLQVHCSNFGDCKEDESYTESRKKLVERINIINNYKEQVNLI
ncbi:dynamin-like protein [Hokovirus HKV1]|uniref:Dynamin-like protein n=1 Tax=Hokovirus HKV1 TaxID=1977638 RepID=A0A1V0SGC7_9VIRU|nr:dynamin-like protein [Hokovirus HKV1]